MEGYDIFIGRAIGRIAGAVMRESDSDMTADLEKMLSEMFGVESIEMKGMEKYGSDRSKLIDYISNTKRPYIDNQLSEYSSFPEFIGYWHNGYKSCAVVPVMASGRLVAVLEMRSKAEGFFAERTVAAVLDVAHIIGLSVTLRAEESKSKRLAEYFNSAFGLPMPQLIVDSEGRVVRMNQECRRLTGYADGSHASVTELLGLDFMAVRRAGSKPVISGLGSPNRHYRITSTSMGGGLFYISISDITSEHMLGAVKGAMDERYGAGMLVLDSQLAIVDATESMKMLTGYESALLSGKSVLDILAERERGKFKEHVGDMGASTRVTGATGLSTSSGTISNVRYSLAKTGSGYVMLLYDSNAEQYFKGMERAVDDFIDSSTDIALKLDELGTITYANHSLEEVLGYERSEIVGREIRDIYIDGSTLDRDLGHVRNGGSVNNSYAVLLAKDGRKVEVINSMRLFTRNGSMEYLIMAKELETKRQMNDLRGEVYKMKNNEKKLRAEGDLKSQFIYNISHELKTPLTNIIGFSKLLYAGEFGDLNMDQLDHISTIIAETNRLLDMIKQVLDAAKLDSDKMKLDLGEVDLKEFEEIPSIKALAESARSKGLDFGWSVAFDVPPIIADRGRLIQVFVNLIGNAIKFTSSGSILVKVVRKNSKVECSVTDTGIGISDEDRRRLFKKWFDVQKKGRVRQEGTGTGLGLAITKDIIKIHKGDIWYEQRDGGGSVFKFLLPIKPRKERKPHLSN